MVKKRYLTLVILVTGMLLASCRSDIPIGTPSAAEPTSSPLLASSCQVALIGKWQDEGGVVISIRNFAGDYELTREYPDGRNESKPLGVKNVGGVVQFYEDVKNF